MSLLCSGSRGRGGDGSGDVTVACTEEVAYHKCHHLIADRQHHPNSIVLRKARGPNVTSVARHFDDSLGAALMNWSRPGSCYHGSAAEGEGQQKELHGVSEDAGPTRVPSTWPRHLLTTVENQASCNG
jgi:hypothetical protein